MDVLYSFIFMEIVKQRTISHIVLSYVYSHKIIKENILCRRNNIFITLQLSSITSHLVSQVQVFKLMTCQILLDQQMTENYGKYLTL